MTADPAKICKCRHAQDQHDEDGFCLVEDGVLGFCKCDSGDPKGIEEPPEGTVADDS